MGTDSPLPAEWLGRVGYRETWALQERLRTAFLDGEGRERLLLLEHHPVVTLGRNADPGHVLLDEQALAARGVDRVVCNRGGDVTCHGPGQLVAYPVVRLQRGVVAHVEAMARAVIAVAAARGIEGVFRREQPGVWVGERKLCAFGVHVHRRVAIHGLALNVTAPEEFRYIVPCGIRDAGITSLAELGDSASPLPSVPSLARSLGEALAEALGRTLEWS